ncbi:aromatic acid exporter family protein [Streptomyces sp. NPDC102394]|uniref:FUSC family protein n=1 Tax=Streptomyces sp. NPDC102394 TaxID=3366167 RepID=UPI0037FCC7E9
MSRTKAVFRHAMPAWRRGAGRAARSVRAAWRSPGRERDLVVQSLKAAGAALLAWVVASDGMNDPMALMAPWVALLLVQATVYSSLRQAAQQFAAICVGTLCASGAQALTGTTLGALALCLPVLMLLSNWSRFGDQGVYTATTAVFTLASGTVNATAVGHRLGQAALGAVIGVAVNALVLPPIHLRDVRENLAALAREAGDVLRTVADDLRHERWDTRTTAGWSRATARLEQRMEALRSARRWSRESLRLTSRPLRALRRVPAAVPEGSEDERFSRVTGHVGSLVRTLVVAAEDGRTPALPEGRVLRTYARLLELIAEACAAEGSRLLDGRGVEGADGEGEEARQDLHRWLQEELREQAAGGADRTTVLGSLVLQAENLWVDSVPAAAQVTQITVEEAQQRNTRR